MWRRKPYIVPIENGLYYLTTTLLERLPNSSTVKVTSMKTLPGIIQVSPKDDGKKFVLGNENQEVYKTCFVRYERQDGKPVETRLDQLLENGYEIPDKDCGDCIKYSRDIKPFMAGTKMYLSKIETDWPEKLYAEFTLSDEEKLEKEDFSMNYIKMSEIKLHFTNKDNPEEKLSFKFTDMKGLDTLSKAASKVNNSADARPGVLENDTGSSSMLIKFDNVDQNSEVKSSSYSIQCLQGEEKEEEEEAKVFPFAESNEPVEKKLKLKFGICPICREEIDSEYYSSRLTAKGLASLLEAKEKRNDTNLDVFKGQRIHHLCKQYYIKPDRNKKKPPPEKKKTGRPADRVTMRAFEQVLDYLEENRNHQLTVKDLVLHMGTLLQTSTQEPYSEKWMKKKLMDRFPGKLKILEGDVLRFVDVECEAAGADAAAAATASSEESAKKNLM